MPTVPNFPYTSGSPPTTLAHSHRLGHGHHLGTSDSFDRKVGVQQEGDRHLSDHSSTHPAPLWAQSQGSVTEKSHLTAQRKMRWWQQPSKVQSGLLPEGPPGERGSPSSPPLPTLSRVNLLPTDPKAGARWSLNSTRRQLLQEGLGGERGNQHQKQGLGIFLRFLFISTGYSCPCYDK